FNAAGTQVVTASRDGTARVWDLSTGDELYTLQDTGRISSLAFSPDSRILAGGNPSNDTVGLWDMSTGEAIDFLPSDDVFSISFNANGSRIASSNFDHTVRIWKIPTRFRSVK
ncbi:MAG: hypothetical protein AAFR97_12160, partial [Bacteroidota bacterium]